jgi:two-component system, OmpR family, response regulator CpxR
MAILLVDDDQELGALMRELLVREGLELHTEADGPAGLRRMIEERHDLVILDVMLPLLDGFEVLRRARKRTDVPVILLTARGGHDDRIEGFNAGADDYLPKPFSAVELLARIRAVLRRSAGAALRRDREMTAGALRIVPASREAWRGSRRLELTGTEFEILELLIRARGRIVTRDEMFAALYQREASPFERSMDVHIGHLRKKLGPDGDQIIRTVRGVGYEISETT